MRCPNCNNPLRFVANLDIADAVDYVFEGLVQDGYVPHRDEVEVLIYHVIDYLTEVGFLDNEQRHDPCI
jgi:hypothetical protein